MSTPFQANFYAPLIKKMELEYEFLVTARNHDNIFAILDAKKIGYTSVGKHGGKDLDGKLNAYAETIREMLPLVKEHKPDLLLTERWPEAVRVAFGFDIPAWTIFYDERERHVNQMVFPLSSKVFSPSFYTSHDLFKNGVTDPSKVVWFKGFHTGYLKGHIPNGNDPFKEHGINHPVVLVRPEPEFATFFPSHKPVLEEAVKLLGQSGDGNGGKLNLVILPRGPAQAARFSKMGTVLDYSTIECPVAHADLVLGSAETMLMESVALCKPAISSIYWTESKPVMELHKYIPHSTDPKEICDTVQRCCNAGVQKRFTERLKVVTAAMDNPVDIVIDSIREIDEDYRPKTASSTRRSHFEKLMDVVRATTTGPAKPTRVMKLANIPYSEFKTLVKTLEKKGLIESESSLSGKFYRTTSHGLQILQDYQGIKSKLFDT
jgi:predicted glycosyltransferase